MRDTHLTYPNQRSRVHDPKETLRTIDSTGMTSTYVMTMDLSTIYTMSAFINVFVL